MFRTLQTLVVVMMYRFFQLLPIATVHSEIVDFVTIPPETYGSSAANFSAASFVVKTKSAFICISSWRRWKKWVSRAAFNECVKSKHYRHTYLHLARQILEGSMAHRSRRFLPLPFLLQVLNDLPCTVLSIIILKEIWTIGFQQKIKKEMHQWSSWSVFTFSNTSGMYS